MAILNCVAIKLSNRKAQALGDAWLDPLGELHQADGGHICWAATEFLDWGTEYSDLLYKSDEASDEDFYDKVYTEMYRQGWVRLIRFSKGYVIDTNRSRSGPDGLNRTQRAALERLGIERDQIIQTDTGKIVYEPPKEEGNRLAYQAPVIYVGVVDSYGAVAAIKGSNKTFHTELGGIRGDAWRYVVGTDEIIWWYLPPEDSKHAVENYLSKKGFDVSRHRLIFPTEKSQGFPEDHTGDDAAEWLAHSGKKPTSKQKEWMNKVGPYYSSRAAISGEAWWMDKSGKLIGLGTGGDDGQGDHQEWAASRNTSMDELLAKGYLRVRSDVNPSDIYFQGNPNAKQLKQLKDLAIERRQNLVDDTGRVFHKRTAQALPSLSLGGQNLKVKHLATQKEQAQGFQGYKEIPKWEAFLFPNCGEHHFICITLELHSSWFPWTLETGWLVRKFVILKPRENLWPKGRVDISLNSTLSMTNGLRSARSLGRSGRVNRLILQSPNSVGWTLIVNYIL